MIREGGQTSGDGDVLAGTQFSQITRAMHLTVRARAINTTTTGSTLATFDSGRTYEFSSGAVALSQGVLNQQGPSLLANSYPPPAPIGLGPDDVLYSGMVNPSTLKLIFNNDDTTTIWDVTAA